jgi:hypothetical protein
MSQLPYILIHESEVLGQETIHDAIIEKMCSQKYTSNLHLVCWHVLYVKTTSD